MNKIEYIDNNIGTTSEEFYNKASKLLRAMMGKDLVDYVSYDTWIKPFREVCSVAEKGSILVSHPMAYIERVDDYIISLVCSGDIDEKWYKFEFLNKEGE